MIEVRFACLTKNCKYICCAYPIKLYPYDLIKLIAFYHDNILFKGHSDTKSPKEIEILVKNEPVGIVITPSFLMMPDAYLFPKLTKEGLRCSFLSKKLCTINYENMDSFGSLKPHFCRAFPFNFSMKNKKAVMKIAKDTTCPIIENEEGTIIKNLRFEEKELLAEYIENQKVLDGIRAAINKNSIGSVQYADVISDAYIDFCKSVARGNPIDKSLHRFQELIS